MRILVTGMSGTGKSSALVELGRRGLRIVDTDSTEWSEWFPDADGGRGEWRWREDRMAELPATADERRPLEEVVADLVAIGQESRSTR